MEPKKLGKYSLLEVLGKGGFGTVYKATDNIGRTVAVKVLKPGYADDPETLDRFRREALAAGSLFHARIATILDLDEADGRYFLVMRYIDGRSLEQILKNEGRLNWEKAIDILQQVAEALDFAHARGFIHRDVKPGNILISQSEGAVLTDFGLVKAVQSSGMSTTGVMLGTPNYIAPETWQGKDVCPQTDVYSLACVFYEMLLGKKLFAGDSAPMVMMKHFSPPELPEMWPEGVPPYVTDVFRKALEKEPAARYPSCAGFSQAVKQPIQKSPERKVIVPQAVPQVIRVPEAGETLIWEKDGSEMVYIPAGEFLMGSSDVDTIAYPDEKPQHMVYLDGYWIDKYPVTNAQFARFVRDTGYEWNHFAQGKDNHPVVMVSWHDAEAYCCWTGKRLPTEAEWEKAARGTNARIYPWGDILTPGNANYYSRVGATTPVGKYRDGASPYGVLDMAGNVWEWVSDWYDAGTYKNSPSKNPAGPTTGEYRAWRGGSWSSEARHVRSASRSGNLPGSGYSSVGFRCSCSE